MTRCQITVTAAFVALTSIPAFAAPKSLVLAATDSEPDAYYRGSDALPGPASQPMHGQYRIQDGKARFTDCTSGQSYPLAEGGDSDALEKAYLSLGRTGEPWLTVRFSGHLGHLPHTDKKPAEDVLVIDRLDGAWPGQDCSGPTLEATDWRLVEIAGRPLEAGERAANPSLRLEPDRLQVLGNTGCNRFFGGYRRDGDTGLAFEKIAGTRKYCMEGMDLEQALLEALRDTTGFAITDGRLVLLNATGNSLAVFDQGPGAIEEPH